MQRLGVNNARRTINQPAANYSRLLSSSSQPSIHHQPYIAHMHVVYTKLSSPLFLTAARNDCALALNFERSVAARHKRANERPERVKGVTKSSPATLKVAVCVCASRAMIVIAAASRGIYNGPTAPPPPLNDSLHALLACFRTTHTHTESYSPVSIFITHASASAEGPYIFFRTLESMYLPRERARERVRVI